MTHLCRSALSFKLMEKLALGELDDGEVTAFHTELSGQTRGEDFVALCRGVWREENVLAIPQPGLRNARQGFRMHETPDALKRISSRFDKRVLIRARVSTDLRLCGELPVQALFASLPFGFQ